MIYRKLVLLLVLALSYTATYAQHEEPKHETKAEQSSPVDVFNSLQEGNERFITNTPEHKDFIKQREVLSKGQKPSTIIVTCSDSRVAPEYIFDKGLGEVFIVRTAGNVVDSVELGSIEYAAEHLHSQLILVLGHTACGAVTAACGEKTPSENINSILRRIYPAVDAAKGRNLHDQALVNGAIEDNVKLQMKNIMQKSDIIKELNSEGHITVLGGVYDIKTGKVNYITNYNWKNTEEGKAHKKQHKEEEHDDGH